MGVEFVKHVHRNRKRDKMIWKMKQCDLIAHIVSIYLKKVEIYRSEFVILIRFFFKKART